MHCPFLKESRVRYCESAAVRKLIPTAQTAGAEERCSSADYVRCQVFQQPPHSDQAYGDQCPKLRESIMQFCAAAPVAKFVPYSESLLSRCGNDDHRYCELYLEMAHPNVEADCVGKIAMPGWLKYSANHMWLDVTEGGTCHAGMDAFAARALGAIDRISYVWTKGVHRPSAVLTIAGSDLQVTLPNPMMLTACNLYLRANPAKLSGEPYTAGWLFEGTAVPGTLDNLLEGQAARDWMACEERSMSEYLQAQAVHDLGPMSADGGTFVEGVVRHLEREQMLTLFNEFFSPYASGKRER